MVYPRKAYFKGIKIIIFKHFCINNFGFCFFLFGTVIITEDLISIEDIPFSFINIHKPLKNGLWYWQYRSTNGNWSEIASFKVDNNSIDFVPPSFETLINSIPKSHPRVMVKKEKWDEVSLKSTSYKESKKIIEQADKIISRRIPSERDAQIQFEGRDAFETEKIKKNFSQNLRF